MRIYSPADLAKLIAEIRDTYKQSGFHASFVLSTLYADPLGSQHLSYLQGASRLGNFWIAAINSNECAVRKKGYYFQDENERAKIVSGCRHVHYVTIWDKSSCADLIRLIRPNVVTNGGNDRLHLNDLDSDELRACREVGAKMIVGVGGKEKTGSSSQTVKDFLTRISPTAQGV